MFTVKVFEKDGTRVSYICKSYWVIPEDAKVSMDMQNGDIVNIIVSKGMANSVYIENPYGKTVDAFKLNSDGSNQGFN